MIAGKYAGRRFLSTDGFVSTGAVGCASCLSGRYSNSSSGAEECATCVARSETVDNKVNNKVNNKVIRH